MALLTGPRNTPRKDVDSLLTPMGVEAATTIHLGGLVCSDDNGYAYPAQPVTGSTPLTKMPIVMGVAWDVVNGQFGEDAANVAGSAMIPNPSNLGSAGAIMIEVKRGVFLLDINSTSITFANMGQLCFAVDDHTVDVSDGSGLTTVTAAAFTPAAVGASTSLAHENIQVGSVVITNTGVTVTYAEGTDYDVDYQDGLVTAISTAFNTSAAKITYKWMSTTATRPVVGQIVGVESGMVWVDTRRQSALAV